MLRFTACFGPRALLLAGLVLGAGCHAHDYDFEATRVAASRIAPAAGATRTGTMGTPCDALAGCSGELVCLAVPAGRSSGYCTRRCPNDGETCDDAPKNTRGLCAFFAEGALYCGLVCSVDHGDHGHSYPCGAGLKCGAERNPPGSPLKVCENAAGG